MKISSIVCVLACSSTVLFAHAPTKSRTHDCTLGARAARAGQIDRALLEWRVIAADNSQKSWAQASSNCLKSAGIAKTDEAVFKWFGHAVNAKSRYALVPLALMYISGIGVDADIGRGRSLLSDASRQGDEAAEFLLIKLAEYTEPPR